ncbi:metallophosphoesterase [Paenibacillus thalictri]|uniref:Hydrolase n=1 Tax=Paenibacillus thalictri TaxID=2527873 RepID=A0A4V2J4R5_9BACL|nr:metallophosphoesterase [Paenibacillus thalictri]TBL80842.1 hydrolase [Paenibacillus thalictri]
MNKFYIADPHFGHEAVIRMCGRPFATIDEMDNAIMRNWNQTVGNEDEVYIVGDFMLRSRHTPEYYLRQLSGRKHLILGNHEKWTKRLELTAYFESVSQIKEITDLDRHLVLCHYPMAEWPRYYKGSLHVFGHIHNNRDCDAFRYYGNNPNMLNAGVDINHFTPVGLQQLIANNEAFRLGGELDERLH